MNIEYHLEICATHYVHGKSKSPNHSLTLSLIRATVNLKLPTRRKDTTETIVKLGACNISDVSVLSNAKDVFLDFCYDLVDVSALK